MGQAVRVADLQTLWICDGRVVQELPPDDCEASTLELAIRRRGMVAVTISEVGTTIRWAVLSPNWSSLFYAMESLYQYPGPYHLQYYLAGWFNETFPTCRAARDRIHTLVAKSDVHLLTRTYVKHADPDAKKMPQLLQHVWGDRAVKPDYSIDCIHDSHDDRFKVMRIGPGSTIAKLWGIFPVSYPCVNGGPYDDVVSEIYPRVIETGEPHYGHVYAAMVFPNRELRWFPYHRIVLPHKFPDGRDGVTVVSEFSPVDIQIV